MKWIFKAKFLQDEIFQEIFQVFQFPQTCKLFKLSKVFQRVLEIEHCTMHQASKSTRHRTLHNAPSKLYEGHLIKSKLNEMGFLIFFTTKKPFLPQVLYSFGISGFFVIF